MTPIGVLGATGRTGQLVVAELARRALPCLAAGRDAGALEALAHDLPGVTACTVAIEDASSLRRLLGRCGVVINCVGPFSRFGSPVLEAAIDASTHYVDCAGEQRFIAAVFERFDAPARSRGVALVPAFGFDYALGDALAHLCAGGRSVREVRIAYAVDGLAPSPGSVRSALAAIREPTLTYRDGALRTGDAADARGVYPFPPPLGAREVTGLAAGEPITVPRHVDTGTVTVLITAATFARRPGTRALLRTLLPVIGLLGRTPAGAAIAAGARGGAGDADRSRFMVVAQAHHLDGTLERRALAGSRVYRVTAHILATAAQALTQAPAAGALAASQVIDPAALLDEVAGSGLASPVDVGPSTITPPPAAGTRKK